MADKDFVIKNGVRTVGNSFIANSTHVTVSGNLVISNNFIDYKKCLLKLIIY